VSDVTNVDIDMSDPLEVEEEVLASGGGFRTRTPKLWGKVYFLEAVGARRIKIGWTAGDVARRISNLFCGCPFDLRCLGWINAHRREERLTHDRFAHLLAKGGSEWFHDAPELRAFIAERCSRRSLRLERERAAAEAAIGRAETQEALRRIRRIARGAP